MGEKSALNRAQRTRSGPDRRLRAVTADLRCQGILLRRRQFGVRGSSAIAGHSRDPETIQRDLRPQSTRDGTAGCSTIESQL